MKKIAVLLFVSLAEVICFAGQDVLSELKELYRTVHDRQSDDMPLEKRYAHVESMRDRVRPAVSNEFAKLANGEVSPLARELLGDHEAMEFCWSVIYTLFPALPADAQVRGLNAAFSASPESQRAEVVLLLVHKLPREAFYGDEIQRWIVDKINAGLPGGVLYFILTDKSAAAVSETARDSMRRFSRGRENNDMNLFSLVSAAFLASRGDKEALKRLGSLIDKRDIDSILDTAYIIPAAAMSGNDKLVRKLCDIIATDRRSRWYGEDCMPREASFAHVAANACSLVVEGFPQVRFWLDFDDATRRKVMGWLDRNPTYSVMHRPCVVFQDTPFVTLIPTMIKEFKAKCGTGTP